MNSIVTLEVDERNTADISISKSVLLYLLSDDIEKLVEEKAEKYAQVYADAEDDLDAANDKIKDLEKQIKILEDKLKEFTVEN